MLASIKTRQVGCKKLQFESILNHIISIYCKNFSSNYFRSFFTP